MRLTKLEVQGFKSFADPIKLNFDAGITGIVGPNGCGKSNVVDAIRWVLGEQKTRNLRSEKMEDVIFNGTSQRKRANVAEVAITFENTRNILPTEYTTVTVTRKLYRDGDSEYLINQVPCRLKDIHNLFMDTGIGSDSYAIIELGMVEDLIKDKANARRQLFEEAAGVSRYKLRKKETLGKLDEVEKNLERVEDILFEIDKNLKSLEKQAKRAEQYLNLKAQYRHASSQLAYLKVENLLHQHEQLKAQDEQLVEGVTQAQSGAHLHEARVQELNKDIIQQEQVLNKEQKKYNQHVEHIRKLEREKEVRSERLKFYQKNEEELQHQIEQNKQKADFNTKNIQRLEQEVEQTAQTVQTRAGETKALELQVAELQAQNKQQKTELDAHAQQLKEQEQSLQQQIRERELRTYQSSSLQGQLKQTEEDTESRSQDIDAFQEKIQTLQRAADELEQTVLAGQKRKLETEAAIQRLREENEQHADQLARLRRTLDAKQNEYNLTKSLVDSLDGFPESVRWLKQQVPVTREAPLIGDIFAADDQLKIPLENYLEPYLNYYVVFSRADALRALAMLKDSSKGRANFFILEEIKQEMRARKAKPAYRPKDGKPAQPVLELVEYSEEYAELARYLLEGVYLYDGEVSGEDIPEHVALIRSSGAAINKRFSVGGGSIGLFEGKRLGRAKNLGKLDKEIEKLSAKLEKEEAELAGRKAQLAELQNQLPGKELEQQQRSLVDQQKQLEVVKTKAQEYRNLIERTGARREGIEQEIAKLEAELKAREPQLAQLQAEVDQLYRTQNQMAEAWQRLNDQYTELNQTYNQQNIAYHQSENLLGNLKRELDQEQDRRKNLHTQLEQLKKNLDEARAQVKDLVDNNLSNDDEIVALYDTKKQMEEHLTFLEDRLANTKTSLQQVDKGIREARSKEQQIQALRNDLRDQMNELRLQQSSVRERLQVEWHLTIEELDIETLFGTPTPELSVDEVEKTVLRLREKYAKFGEVNTTAPEAYNEIKERHDFITEQKADLIQAKQDLVQTIAEIDETACTQFMEAFDQIRAHFQRVFRTLFTQEDDCDIVLANPDDPLESPIEVMARPKGKRPSAITQLSGGEKTLTAISLLFSIYLIKPAPFCIFDEVDAPLDDANIDKFNNIMQEFSSESQFIIVTHNKRTMVKTHIMYGVTMEETGISRVLPVDLQTLKLQPA